MAMRVSINDEILEDIADSIRTKTETTAKMHPQEMANKIDTIETLNLQSKSQTITNNGTYNITPDSSHNGLSSVEVTANVALDLTNYYNYNVDSTNYPYIYSASIFDMICKKLPDNFSMGSSFADYRYFFTNCRGLTTAPTMDLSHAQNTSYMFNNCVNIETVPLYDLSNVQVTQNMFNNCQKLHNVPAITLPACQGLYSMFAGCLELTNDSMNNILAMCISTTIYTGTKTLYYLFGNRNNALYYPVSMIEGLSNYAAFTAAGWSIGWS